MRGKEKKKIPYLYEDLPIKFCYSSDELFKIYDETEFVLRASYPDKLDIHSQEIAGDYVEFGRTPTHKWVRKVIWEKTEVIVGAVCK